MSDCPSEDTLLAFVGGFLPPEEAASLERHLESCEACSAVLAEAGRALIASIDSSRPPSSAPFASEPARPLPEVGDKVGRYHLVEPLGKGAMGVVYAAYDPELDRRVAVKLVRLDRHVGALDAELQARLMGEAQAMARLSHRNVVAVHDIGTLEAGGIYLAMELVKGKTLRGWLVEPRTWRQIVEVFVQAGEGLAAAHAADIVHRDFKPDNVLVEDSGRVLVTDFGLARLALRDLGGSRPASSDLKRTRAGSIIGTPAYMAPEQLFGTEVDARADVFAFGASLYEALFAQRPYEGQTLAELEAALRRGTPREPPKTVPAWLRRVVLKALAGDREQRFASMAELLRALRADPRKTLVRVVLPIGILVVVAAGVALAWNVATAPGRACREGAARAESVWSTTRKDAVKAAFMATGSPFAADTYERVARALDAATATWASERIEACDATHDRGEQSEGLLDLRLACLDDRLGELDALVDVFTSADAAVVRRAPDAAARLPDARICGEVERLRARVAPPTDPNAREQAHAASEANATGLAQALAGKFDDAKKNAERAVTLATSSGHLPTEAEAHVLLGRVLFLAGDNEGSRTSYERGLQKGLAAGDDRVAAYGAIGIAQNLSLVAADTAQATRWLDVAEAEITRLGGDKQLLVAALLIRSDAALFQEKAALALPILERALALTAEAYPPNDPIVARTLDQKANALQQLGRWDESIATYDQAVALARSAAGPRHPLTLNILANEGNALNDAGRPGESAAVLEPTLAAAREVYPKVHYNRAIIMHMYAFALGKLGRYDEARALDREALAIEEELFGDDPGQLVYALAAMAQTEIAAGLGDDAQKTLARAATVGKASIADNATLGAGIEAARAVALEVSGRFDEALAIARAQEPGARTRADRGTLATVLDLLGRDLVRNGHSQDAVAKHREALTLGEARYGADNVELVATLRDLGAALVAAGQPAPELDRAEALLAKHAHDPLLAAEVRFVRARANKSTTLTNEARALIDGAPGKSSARALKLRAAIDAVAW